MIFHYDSTDHSSIVDHRSTYFSISLYGQKQSGTVPAAIYSIRMVTKLLSNQSLHIHLPGWYLEVPHRRGGLPFPFLFALA